MDNIVYLEMQAKEPELGELYERISNLVHEYQISTMAAVGVLELVKSRLLMPEVEE